LFLIIAIVAVAKPSIILVMAVIGLTSWTEIARFIRAELLKVRNLEYIEAAQALGFSNTRIMMKHAIPNSISPVLIAVAFGIASAVLVEGFLSFIGIGIPPEILSWGKLLSLSRSAPWWFAIAPGFAIFLMVTLFNLLGEGLTDAMDPRQKK
jgi:peptide/nickel transport system permease protein